MNLIIPAIRCLKCGDLIFSRAQHDCRSCSCGLCNIDGGFHYLKICGPHDQFQFFQLTMHEEITKQTLFDDWMKSKESTFGLYKKGKIISDIIDIN